jgi:hypothetical protein
LTDPIPTRLRATGGICYPEPRWRLTNELSRENSPFINEFCVPPTSSDRGA